MIQLRNVEKTIKSPAGTVWLLRRINVDIKEGEFVTIMGPSGAGKTTLLSIIGMLDDGWAGEYVFAEQLVHKLDRKKRAELNRRFVGFVFQSYHLLDNLTVQENIDVPLSYRDIPRAQRASMVADILDRFQIVGKKDLYPNQLSGGQQQLVGVARAVAGNPKLILADEPTRQSAFRTGQRDHGAVQKIESAGNYDHSGNAFGSERGVWQSDYSAERRVDCGRFRGGSGAQRQAPPIEP